MCVFFIPSFFLKLGPCFAQSLVDGFGRSDPESPYSTNKRSALKNKLTYRLFWVYDSVSEDYHMSNRIAWVAAALLAGFLMSQFQCSAKDDIETFKRDVDEKYQAREKCLLNPETCSMPDQSPDPK